MILKTGSVIVPWDSYYNKNQYIYSTYNSEGAVKAVKYLKSLGEKIKMKRKYTIIDVGCGYGRDLKYFYRNRIGLFDKIIGVDISPVAIKKAKEFLSQELRRKNIFLENFDFFKFIEDHSFKDLISHNEIIVIYTHYFLQILSEQERNLFWEKLKRSFKNKNLMVILNEYSWNNPRRKTLKKSEEEGTYILYKDNPYHKVHFFKKEEFYIAGFEILQIYEYQEKEIIGDTVIDSLNWFVAMERR